MTQPSTTSQPALKPVQSTRLILGTIASFLKTIIGAYALSVILQLVLRFLIGEQVNWIAFFNTFAHLLWIPALILLPLCLLLRQWLLSALLLPAVAAFLLAYGPQFIPRAEEPPPGAETLELLTYNLFARQGDFSVIDAVIRDADADIVALQEISLQARNRFPEAFSDLYPYTAFYATGHATAGMGLMSRYPITEETFWQSDYVPFPLGFLRATLDIDGTPITLYNAHPTHPGMAGSFFDPTNRGREIADLLNRAAQDTGIVLLAGDFNMPDQSEDYAEITRQYQDAYHEVGWGMGWTFPDKNGGTPGVYNVTSLADLIPIFPILRLDYVFYRGSIQALQAEVWPTSGTSDHHPLWVQLEINPTPDQAE